MADFEMRVWDNERILMVGFARAKSGEAHWLYPDIDDLGYNDDSQRGEHGFITSTLVGTKTVCVSIERHEISAAAPLYVTSSNPAVLRVSNPAEGKLAGVRRQRISFWGRRVGRASLEIRYGWNDGPVIGRLYVEVYSRINVEVRAHLVTLPGVSHNPNNFLGGVHPTGASQLEAIKKLIREANHTWLTHGIYLKLFGGLANSAWGAAEMGAATNNPNFNQVLRGGALSPNRDGGRVNLYLLPRWNDPGNAWGANLPWANRSIGTIPNPAGGAARHINGVYVRTNALFTGRDLAHEFGHYMGLLYLNPPGGTPAAAVGAVVPQEIGHSPYDVFNSQPTRDDVITRRRLMYPSTQLLPSGQAWRNNSGYGANRPGSLVTYRQLAQDVTTRESWRARDATRANFYAL